LIMGVLRAFPVLETERLLLRETTMNDARAILNVFTDEEVTRYYNVSPFTDIEQARQVVAGRRRRFESGQGIRWAIARKEDNQVIGSCGYTNWVAEWRKAEIGYELGRPHWGHGIMTEALREIIRFGFQRMNLNRIEAMVMPPNTASANVLIKLGFMEEGLLREVGYWKGQHHDLKMYSLLKRESQID
jgi:ribosomal-protein-alanine N-acetyltransferase